MVMPDNRRIQREPMTIGGVIKRMNQCSGRSCQGNGEFFWNSLSSALTQVDDCIEFDPHERETSRSFFCRLLFYTLDDKLALAADE